MTEKRKFALARLLYEYGAAQIAATARTASQKSKEFFTCIFHSVLLLWSQQHKAFQTSHRLHEVGTSHDFADGTLLF